ncbi:hypothetical protein [Amycolatopsis sp. lyj-23]|uniref:hypothetical protein n=1 Tax=Amycolatopsis sp. lyj-23 TaxID=2789283 RepID=UPI00397E3DBE
MTEKDDTTTDLRAEEFDRAAVETVLAAGDWAGWDDLLEWLRTDGPGVPELAPGALRGIRQDAERACAKGFPLPRDPDHLYAVLRGQHRARAQD